MALFMQMKLNMSVSVIMKTELSQTEVRTKRRRQLGAGLLMFFLPVFDLRSLIAQEIKLKSIVDPPMT